jgi:mannose/fructose/N-acetylgalactosamine-specific phosphotransferase system component IID
MSNSKYCPIEGSANLNYNTPAFRSHHKNKKTTQNNLQNIIIHFHDVIITILPWWLVQFQAHFPAIARRG